ncbi:MAG TPA: hypothetical protein VNB49_14300 [Candidatus Dormibacteraeota bacterium]|nr:hypothetical protein [Candidatus Dormibacteraeota bacterium]
MARQVRIVFSCPILALCLLAPTRVTAQPQTNFTEAQLPVFELHSGFWINLHHALYNEARQRRAYLSRDRNTSKSAQPTFKSVITGKVLLSDTEQKTWDDAVAYYILNYADKDLLFTTELIQLKDQLGDFEDCDELSGRKRKFCDAGLPPNLVQVLEAVAPVYRAHLWAGHDQANRRWILQVAPLVREQGVGLSERLADIYQTRWPHEKIRVDVVAYANWAGAYTTVDPLRVTISSLDPRNQGPQALEVLFHEGSHGIAEPVEAAIIRECRQRDKPIPRDLWHALVFYTTGEVIRTVLASSLTSGGNKGSGAPGNAYSAYGFREGLYQRGWKTYLELLQRFWQPYLDGKASFDDAIARMVSSL